jgi:hypothetical protein
MNKEFIPYEQALELKELGFKKDNDFGLLYKGDGIPSILYQQAFRWFREKHNLKGGILYIGGLKPETTWWDIYVVGHYNIEYNEMEMKYQPYEEAELACLKKLIEIAKNK